MRISKIFHWLYASVMLMPIFAIGVKCLYTTFNPNAKDSYYGETINEIEYNSVSQLDIQNSYYFKSYLTNTDIENTAYTLTITNIRNYNIPNINSTLLNAIENNEITKFRFSMFNDNLLVNLRFEDNTNAQNFTLSVEQLSFEFDLVNVSSQPTLVMDMFFNVSYNDYSYIDNVFYYSVNQINNEPLFSWAQSSFLSQPLLFITNFFGVPSTSPILTILCYWFSISVIWLVFDAVMYFPLLIHRWLDKGVIE